MKQNFARALSTLTSPQRLLAGTEPYGDSVRLKKREPTDPRPPHLYLVYVALDDNGLVVRHIEKDIDPAELEDEEDALIRDAKNGVNLVGSNFDLLLFKEATNFTIVLDEDDWAFYYPDPHNPEPPYDETHDPIVFISEKSFINDGSTTVVSRPVSRNRAFYDLEPITKAIDGEARKGIRCINHFTKNAQGDPVGIGEEVDYSFNVFLRVPFSKTTATKKVTIIIDPDGQNQGPPAPHPVVEGDELGLVESEYAE